MREIIVAPHSGFCFGVENAIKTAEKEGSHNCPLFLRLKQRICQVHLL